MTGRRPAVRLPHGEDLSGHDDAELVAIRAKALAVAARKRASILVAKGEMDRATALAARVAAERRSRSAKRALLDPEDTPQRRGGLARASSMTPEERKAVARKAGRARWGKDA